MTDGVSSAISTNQECQIRKEIKLYLSNIQYTNYREPKVKQKCEKKADRKSISYFRTKVGLPSGMRKKLNLKKILNTLFYMAVLPYS